MELSVDIPKLYTAFAEWLSCFVIILAHRYLLRHSRPDANLSVLAGVLALLSVIQIICGMISNALWLLGMLAAVFMMYVCLHSMLRISPRTAVYTLARTFMWAELTAALEWQLDRFYVPEKWESSLWFSAIFCMVIYAGMACILYNIEHRYLQEHMDMSKSPVSIRDLIQVWGMTVVFFSMSNLSYVKVNSPFSGSSLAEIFNIRTILDLAGVIMLELLYVQKAEADRRQEISAIRNVLHTQYMQFRQSQENMDLINEKYHDMKHQLQVLRAQSSSETYLEYIDELEKEIQIYETEYHTGNSILDTILTSKSHLCLKREIQLHVVADGSLLSHLHVMDLATIFGNALDNAIEHELQIPDKVKRLIHVSISRKNQMVCILIENYFQGTLLTDGEDLLTTKTDTQYHGYGVKSIRHACSKYGGIMTTGVEENWFQLKILLPFVQS